MVTNSGSNIQTAAAGKVLQGAGVGVANTFSTATYPATAGTSGNVLTSDGTDWNSSAPASSSSFSGSLQTAASAYNDSTTYYFGTAIAATATTLTTQNKFFAPKACTVTAVYGEFSNTGVVGSAENVTFFVRKNNTTNTNLTTTLQLNTSPVAVSFTGLSISLAAGDYISFGITAPAWATNPTSNFVSISFLAT